MRLKDGSQRHLEVIRSAQRTKVRLLILILTLIQQTSITSTMLVFRVVWTGSLLAMLEVYGSNGMQLILTRHIPTNWWSSLSLVLLSKC